MGVQLKFNLILAACFLVGLGLSSYPFYQLSRGEAIELLQSQIEMLRAQALAVRRYTSQEVQPLLGDQSEVQFLPQTMPSFSAQTVFRNFQEDYPQFSYKEASLNPTNLSDLAKDWEVDIIATLEKNPQMNRDVRIRDTNSGSFYTVTYPLRLNDESCLSCHGSPDKAPTSMVALYGKKHGFGWKLKDLVAAQIISVPMSGAQEKIWHRFWQFIGITSVIFLVWIGILDILLNFLVIWPVRKMAQTAEHVSMGDSSVAEYEYVGADEIGSLSRSFNRMRRSLDSAMKMLDVTINATLPSRAE
jgi:protein-histidine pros-kinase